MKTYSAVFVTDAWDVHKDEVIVTFESHNNSKEVLVPLAKVALAKNMYDWKPKEYPAEIAPEVTVADEAEELKCMVIEMENDGFYIKLLGIFEGKSLSEPIDL